MRHTLLFAVILVFCFTSAAYAGNNGFYIGGKAALSSIDVDDIKWGNGKKSDKDFFSAGIGPVVGFDFAKRGGPTLRIEAEVLFRSGDDWKKNYAGGSSKFEVDYMTTFMGNAWYDILSIPAGGITIKPFVGASAGFGVISYERKTSRPGYSKSKDGDEAAFIIGPGGGARFDISDKLAADATLRYLFSTDYDIDGDDYGSSIMELNFGMAYKF